MILVYHAKSSNAMVNMHPGYVQSKFMRYLFKCIIADELRWIQVCCEKHGRCDEKHMKGCSNEKFEILVRIQIAFPSIADIRCGWRKR